jgi:hypothetical protein
MAAPLWEAIQPGWQTEFDAIAFQRGQNPEKMDALKRLKKEMGSCHPVVQVAKMIEPIRRANYFISKINTILGESKKMAFKCRF